MFLNELEKGSKFRTNGSKSYRRITAELSKLFPWKAGHADSFYNRVESKRVIMDTSPNMPHKQIENAAKMMH